MTSTWIASTLVASATLAGVVAAPRWTAQTSGAAATLRGVSAVQRHRGVGQW